MTGPSLLHEQLAASEVINRRRPPRSLFAFAVDWLRRIGDELLVVAEAMLRPESEVDDGAA